MVEKLWPVGSIKNNTVRKVACVIAMPLIFVWVLNWRLIAWPLAVLWNAIEAAFRAFEQSLAIDCNTPSIRLIRAGTRAAWEGKYAKDPSDA